MWFIDWLPDFVFHLIVLAGILGLVAAQFFKFIPFVSQYETPIKIAAIVALVIGIWFEGGISNEAKWQARVVELEKKVAESEVKSAQQNVKIVEKVVTKDRIIKEKGDEIIRYVDREITKYDAQCTIPQEFIKAHNNAAEGTK